MRISRDAFSVHGAAAIQRLAAFSSGPVSSTSGSSAGGKEKVFYPCACGNPNPVMKGYCKECVQKLRDKFKVFIDKFKELKKEYDEYNAQDLGKADEKMKLMQNKLAQYGVGGDSDMLDIL